MGGMSSPMVISIVETSTLLSIVPNFQRYMQFEQYCSGVGRQTFRQEVKETSHVHMTHIRAVGWPVRHAPTVGHGHSARQRALRLDLDIDVPALEQVWSNQRSDYRW